MYQRILGFSEFILLSIVLNRSGLLKIMKQDGLDVKLFGTPTLPLILKYMDCWSFITIQQPETTYITPTLQTGMVYYKLEMFKHVMWSCKVALGFWA